MRLGIEDRRLGIVRSALRGKSSISRGGSVDLCVVIAAFDEFGLESHTFFLYVSMNSSRYTTQMMLQREETRVEHFSFLFHKLVANWHPSLSVPDLHSVLKSYHSTHTHTHTHASTYLPTYLGYKPPSPLSLSLALLYLPWFLILSVSVSVMHFLRGVEFLFVGKRKEKKRKGKERKGKERKGLVDIYILSLSFRVLWV